MPRWSIFFNYPPCQVLLAHGGVLGLGLELVEDVALAHQLVLLLALQL